MDKLLHAAVKKARTGHRYLNVVAEDHAKVLNGHTIGDNWMGSATESSHLYDGIRAEENVRVLNGNRCRGKDFFEE